ncbi:MAG: CapA family protein [Parafannyhessea sp.]|uniref:CapA family protein n=1 Tax=Parafannyhessea sp. TaxID=2847324 RepID=UPI003F09E5B0
MAGQNRKPHRETPTGSQRRRTPASSRRGHPRDTRSSRPRDGVRGHDGGHRNGRTLTVLLACALVAVVAVVAIGRACSKPTAAPQGEKTTATARRSSGSGRVSLCAVGDNLANLNTLQYADSWAGTEGDGTYDFSPLYAHVRKKIRSYDIAFVNQETTLGGTAKFGYLGYPSYNTPDSMARAVAGAGFDVVNTNSNHTYDTWVDSIKHAQSVWAGYPKITTIGSYASEADRRNVRTVTKNGITVAFLSYSYGQNGYQQSDLPNDYYAVPWDVDAMRRDMARAKKKADFVVVYLHMGTEYTNAPNDQQTTAAQACADAGAGIVLCSHAHVIQPLAWVKRSDGSGRTLVAYGLGDFVSGYHVPGCVLSGMLSCDIVRKPKGGLAVRNVVWHTLIEHAEGDVDTVYLASDYSDKLAEKNELLERQADPGTWIRSKTREVIGNGFKIDQ